MSYQYSDQTSLSASSHAYTQSLINPYPFDLIPGQVQQAVFATFAQELRQGASLQGDASYSHRSTSDDFSYGAYYLQTMPALIDNYSASIGSRIDLPHKSQLALTATYSESDTHNQIFETPSPSPLIQDFKTKSALISLDANLDGVLAALPSGPAQYALGGQYRQESYGHNNLQTATDQFYPRRHVGAGYVELHIPIVGPKGGSGGEPTLEVTAADREEHYSDFGSTNNPRVGATWRPSSGLQLRGTYGTSFTAPLLYQLNSVPSFVVADRLTDPTQGGSCVFSSQTGQYTGTCTNALEVYGENPQLKPEKAKTWTLGLDFTPAMLPGLSANVTYYNITFSGQIGNAAGAIGNLANALIDEATLGPSIVQRNPPSSVIQQLISTPNYYNFYNVDPASIRVIIDSRDQNLATVTTKGLDVGLSYKATIPGGQIDTGVNGTRIFAFDDQFISTLQPTEIVNTVFNPVQLRLRAHAILTQRQLTAGVFVNYVGAYSNNLVIPNEHVSSWTTADAFINYDIGSDRGLFRGVSIGLNVTNVTDREPPYVTNPRLAGVPYDGANANPIGRLYSLRIGKRL
jgi:outer membrane receptor protein involved in Fe transport